MLETGLIIRALMRDPMESALLICWQLFTQLSSQSKSRNRSEILC